MRLSREDGVSESASIGTQRNMLRSYAREHGFGVYGEYVDDGFSGTNFDRPGWRRMIRDIENKKLNLVITKDLSRLGRDYIMTGQYTEIYFPSKGVRYIAVNDGYDSESPYTDIAPFKNVINEMYARDASKKIRSALQTKMREGAYIGNFAPYGYRKDPDNKNHLLVDRAVSPIVQGIFGMAENGSSPSEIAKSLNEKGIMTPAAYRCSNHLYLNAGTCSGRKEWTSGMVCKMLRNVVYLGHIAQGKTTKVSFKSSVTLQNPRDEWIVVPNMHEPLISQETFDNVRNRSVSRRNRPKSGFHNIFSGIARCADCGRGMSVTGSRRKDSPYNLVCSGYKLYGSRECSNHFIAYSLLYEIVMQELQKLLTLTAGEKKELADELAGMPAPEKNPGFSDETAALKKRERELDRIIEKLYEDSAAGNLNEERFQKLLARYEAEQKEITARLSRRKKPEQPTAEAEPAGRDFSSLLDELTNVREVTPELLRKLIDKIEIFQGTCGQTERGGLKHQTVKIYYKFADRWTAG